MAVKETQTTGVVDEKKALNDYYKELVEIKLHKDENNYKDDYYVCVNGKNFMIQRGKVVKVPRYIAMQIDESQMHDLATAQLIEQFKSEFNKV